MGRSPASALPGFPARSDVSASEVRTALPSSKCAPCTRTQQAWRWDEGRFGLVAQPLLIVLEHQMIGLRRAQASNQRSELKMNLPMAQVLRDFSAGMPVQCTGLYRADHEHDCQEDLDLIFFRGAIFRETRVCGRQVLVNGLAGKRCDEVLSRSGSYNALRFSIGVSWG